MYNQVSRSMFHNRWNASQGAICHNLPPSAVSAWCAEVQKLEFADLKVKFSAQQTLLLPTWASLVCCQNEIGREHPVDNSCCTKLIAVACVDACVDAPIGIVARCISTEWLHILT
jgi:hypothetical protein